RSSKRRSQERGPALATHQEQVKARDQNMKFRLLLFVPALVSARPLPTLADEVSPYCYRILVDGKDRSAYQYVNKKLLTFADPSWKQDPTVEQVRLVAVTTANPE